MKQFAKILEFVLKFDECKMTTPAIQNDFSYYRRTIQRSRNNSKNPLITKEIRVDIANTMSLFFAHATPMLNALSEATSNFVQRARVNGSNKTPEMLSVMAKVRLSISSFHLVLKLSSLSYCRFAKRCWTLQI